MQFSLFDHAAMRWRGGRTSYRPLHEPIDPTRFHVDRISDALARSFVVQHHYSRTYPASIAAYGLFENTAPLQNELVGVAVFSVSMQPRAADAYGAQGAPFCELGRFVLLDQVGGNGETYFLSRALKRLGVDKRSADGSPKFAVCLAYSDPEPRTDASGKITLKGHTGLIYSAASACYVGKSSPRTLWLAPDGTSLSHRALSKLRNDDTGARYAYEHLLSHGAPAILAGESSKAYVARALSEGPFRRMRHGGNHAFAIPCGTHATRQRMRRLMDRGLPRPSITNAPVAA